MPRDQCGCWWCTAPNNAAGANGNDDEGSRCRRRAFSTTCGYTLTERSTDPPTTSLPFHLCDDIVVEGFQLNANGKVEIEPLSNLHTTKMGQLVRGGGVESQAQQ